jgi:putative transcriptional regulator
MLISLPMETRVRIRELLKEKGITLRELSRRTDIGHATLSKLSNQKLQNVHLPHINKICETLGILDMNQIFETRDMG